MSKNIIDILKIKELIPHRYPFLLVDKVEIIEADEKAIGYKNITANEEIFNGHFPNRPIFPGFMILEALAQTSVIVGKVNREDPNDTLVVLAGTDEAKFKRQVVPGDVLELHVEKIAKKGMFMKFKCVAKVDGDIAATAVISAMEIPVKK